MNRSRLACLALLLLLLPSCLEIDGQEIFLRHDGTSDRIDIMLVHRGIFAEGGEDSLEAAAAHLEHAMSTGKFIIFNNWPLKMDLSTPLPAPYDALAKHLDVENGGLFTDPKGVLCGYQFIRIRRAKEFIRKVNALIELALQAACIKGIPDLDGRKFDEETRDNIREFLRNRRQFLTVNAGRIELNLPLSAADHRVLKEVVRESVTEDIPRAFMGRLSVEQRRQGGGSVTNTKTSKEEVSIKSAVLQREIERSPTHQLFWDNDVSLQRTVDLTTVGLGVVGTEQLHFTKGKDGLYHEAFLLKIRDEQFEIEDGIPDQELQRRFTSFQARDARLPPELAAHRESIGKE